MRNEVAGTISAGNGRNVKSCGKLILSPSTAHKLPYLSLLFPGLTFEGDDSLRGLVQIVRKSLSFAQQFADSPLQGLFAVVDDVDLREKLITILISAEINPRFFGYY